MNKKTGFILIILIVVLVACTAQAAPAPTETPSALPPTPTTQPSATAQSTAVPTVTPTPLSPDAQALKDIVFSDCIPVEESLPEGMEIPWSLLARDGESVFILNPKDGTEVIVPHFSGVSRERDNTFLLASTISPDGKWLAYLDISRKKIFVEPAETILTNKETDRIEWEREQRVYLPQWIDDDTLLVIQTPPEEDSFYPTIFFKPFTGEEYIFSLEAMPNYLDYKIGGIGFRTHYNHSGELVPDPIMKKVVYPEKLNDELYNALWDRETEKTLAKLRFLLGYINDPLWTQDGSDVLLLSSIYDQSGERFVEWFLITSDGIITQITQFEKVLKGFSYYINHSSRSRDGQYFVFQLSYNFRQPNEIIKYILLDLQANPLEGCCLSIEKKGVDFALPIWSPDNKYVLISNVNSDRKGNIFVIDVENETAHKIAQDMEVIGWIEKPEGEK